MAQAAVNEQKHLFMSRWLWMLWATAFLVYWICSSFRHSNYCSEAFDLGIFTQVIWLLAEGKPPFSSLIHKHLLGDHGAYFFYLIAPLYQIAPSPYTLLAFQSFFLSSAVVPIYLIARALDVSTHRCKALCVLALLHPTVFNSNLFDFHPDAIILPGTLLAYYFALKRKFSPYFFVTVLILSCKEIFSLSLTSLGLVMVFVRRMRDFGIYSVLLGIFWLVTTLWFIIPHFSPTGLPAGSERYFRFSGEPIALLGAVFGRWPGVVYGADGVQLFSYLKGLILPALPFLSWKGSLPLLGAVPFIILNLLSTEDFQRNYNFHHSLPIVPFLIIAGLVSSSKMKSKNSYVHLGWVLILFLLVWTKGIYHLGTDYPFKWYRDGQTVAIYDEVVSLVHQSDAVAAPSHLVPHLAERPRVSLLIAGQHGDWSDYDLIIVDSVNPGWGVHGDAIRRMLAELKISKSFSLIFSRSGVFVFRRHPPLIATAL